MRVIGALLTVVGGAGSIISQIVRIYYKNVSPYSWYTSTPYAVKQRAQEFEQIAENAELFFGGFIVILVVGVSLLLIGTMQAKNKTLPYTSPKVQLTNMVRCPVCKNVVLPGTRFCGKCGTALQWQAQGDSSNINAKS